MKKFILLLLALVFTASITQAQVVVVGSESIAILVLADDGTHVGVGAGDA